MKESFSSCCGEPMSESEQCTGGSAGIYDMSGCRSRREKETEVVPLCVLHTSPSPSNSPAASMCASIGASVRAFACPCNCLAACLCLGISLYCSSLLHTPQASLPLPSSSETVQPPNDPNNSVFQKTTRPFNLQTQSSPLHLHQI